jgi:hypothetical protein
MEKVHKRMDRRWRTGKPPRKRMEKFSCFCTLYFFPSFWAPARHYHTTSGSLEAAFFTMMMIQLHNDNQVLLDLPVHLADFGVWHRRVSVHETLCCTWNFYPLFFTLAESSRAELGGLLSLLYLAIQAICKIFLTRPYWHFISSRLIICNVRSCSASMHG